MLHFAPKRRPCLAWLVMTALMAFTKVSSAQQQQQDVLLVPPLLSGRHFRITALDDITLLTIKEKVDGRLDFQGYIIDMFKAVAAKANFTYELFTSSGFGSNCNPQLRLNNTNDAKQQHAARYRTQFDCGVNDVNDMQGTSHGTDMYIGLLYITPERQLKNYFTIAFQPPFQSTPVMAGTTTGIPTMEDLVKAQDLEKHPPACIPGAQHGLRDFLEKKYPDMQLREFHGEEEIMASIFSGDCPLYIASATQAKQITLKRYRDGTCFIDGKPMGVIGEPLESGLSQYAIGVGKHVDRDVVDTLSYWMNVLMIDGTFASLYQGQGGTGKECGYELYPRKEESRLLSEWAIVGVTLGAVVLIALGLCLWYSRRLKKQEKRYKKRFVQQIARNIEIGRRPGCIPPDKLSEQILHIGQGKDRISKADLFKWLHDIKMNFISDKDFDALWDAMDVDGRGVVNAVDFVVFLSACGPEFEEVYEEQKKMPKIERLKLAARRLSNIKKHGELGVRRLERNLENGSERNRNKRETVTSHRSSDSTLTACYSSSRACAPTQPDPLLGTIGQDGAA